MINIKFTLNSQYTLLTFTWTHLCFIYEPSKRNSRTIIYALNSNRTFYLKKQQDKTNLLSDTQGTEDVDRDY